VDIRRIIRSLTRGSFQNFSRFLDLIVEFATAPHLLRICVFIVARLDSMEKSIEHDGFDGYDKNGKN
jgi:hypothetical protein